MFKNSPSCEKVTSDDILSAHYPFLTLMVNILAGELSCSPQIQWNIKEQGQLQTKKRKLQENKEKCTIEKNFKQRKGSNFTVEKSNKHYLR